MIVLCNAPPVIVHDVDFGRQILRFAKLRAPRAPSRERLFQVSDRYRATLRASPFGFDLSQRRMSRLLSPKARPVTKEEVRAEYAEREQVTLHAGPRPRRREPM